MIRAAQPTEPNADVAEEIAHALTGAAPYLVVFWYNVEAVSTTAR